MEFIHATEDILDHEALKTSKSGCSTIRDFDMSFAKHVEGQDAAKELLDSLLKSDYNNEIQSTSAAASQVTQFPQHDSSDISAEKKLEKSATFPCSNKENISLKLWTGVECTPTVFEGNSNTDSQSEKNSDSASGIAKSATCQRSLSLPSTIKVVSALKGSREKQGQTPREARCVKWAPDVYDPPVTSASHTVKNHQQRSKPRKDKHRKRHKNGKSNRANANEKKQVSWSAAISEPPLSRTHVPIEDDARLPPGSSMRCGVDMAEYAAHCQESKCSGCFLAGSRATIQSPVAEAS